MHILLKSDPEIRSGYCPKHEKFHRSHLKELDMQVVQYLAGFPLAREAEEEEA